jgi:hypothetical protein
MRLIISLVVLAAQATVLCASAPAIADTPDQSVQHMLPFCERAVSQSLDHDSLECLNTLIGVSDMGGLNCAARQNGDQAPAWLSHGDGSTYGAQIQAFINWARANPQSWNLNATAGMAIALSLTFRCPY